MDLGSDTEPVGSCAAAATATAEELPLALPEECALPAELGFPPVAGARCHTGPASLRGRPGRRLSTRGVPSAVVAMVVPGAAPAAAAAAAAFVSEIVPAPAPASSLGYVSVVALLRVCACVCVCARLPPLALALAMSCASCVRRRFMLLTRTSVFIWFLSASSRRFSSTVWFCATVRSEVSRSRTALVVAESWSIVSCCSCWHCAVTIAMSCCSDARVGGIAVVVVFAGLGGAVARLFPLEGGIVLLELSRGIAMLAALRAGALLTEP